MAMRRVRAMLRPGGIFRLWDVAYHFSPDEADEHVETWYAPHGDEHSTFTWLLEAMFEQIGFSIETADYSDDGFDTRYLLRAASL